MKVERFEDIEVWQLARELTRKVYLLSKMYTSKLDGSRRGGTVRGFINYLKR